MTMALQETFVARLGTLTCEHHSALAAWLVMAGPENCARPSEHKSFGRRDTVARQWESKRQMWMQQPCNPYTILMQPCFFKDCPGASAACSEFRTAELSRIHTVRMHNMVHACTIQFCSISQLHSANVVQGRRSLCMEVRKAMPRFRLQRFLMRGSAVIFSELRLFSCPSLGRPWATCHGNVNHIMPLPLLQHSCIACDL